MKFAHISDVHIGSWKDPRMKDVSTRVFLEAMDICVRERVDFILISGDLFDTALPAVDLLADVAGKLKFVKDANIPVYIIAGSHDFSPSGKTMLGVLAQAGLVVNVAKGSEVEGKLRLEFTVDPKTRAKITGIIGKKGMLDHHYYTALDRSWLDNEEGYKIFLFHTAISEFKPKDLEMMDAHPLSLLPTGFDYYAGGHVHYIEEFSRPGYKKIVYPGALFPCNFAELQKFSHGYVHIVTDDVVTKIPVSLYDCVHVDITVDHSTPEQALRKVAYALDGHDVGEKIVTLRVSGSVAQGSVGDIDFRSLFRSLYEKGAHFVMKNTSKLEDDSFEETSISVDENVESRLIAEHLPEKKDVAMALVSALHTEKLEGEKVVDFERRVKEEGKKILNL